MVYPPVSKGAQLRTDNVLHRGRASGAGQAGRCGHAGLVRVPATCVAGALNAGARRLRRPAGRAGAAAAPGCPQVGGHCMLFTDTVLLGLTLHTRQKVLRLPAVHPVTGSAPWACSSSPCMLACGAQAAALRRVHGLPGPQWRVAQLRAALLPAAAAPSSTLCQHLGRQPAQRAAPADACVPVGHQSRRSQGPPRLRAPGTRVRPAGNDGRSPNACR